MGQADGLEWRGFSGQSQMNPYIVQSNNPYFPSSGTLTSPAACYGQFTNIDLVRGTNDEVMDTEDVTDHPTDEDVTGDDVSGEHVYIKGMKVSWAINENDSQATAGYETMYRIIICKVNSRDGSNVKMSQNSWRDCFRCGDGGSTTGNAKVNTDVMTSFRDPDSFSNYKFIKDTKWKWLRPRILPTYINDTSNSSYQASFQYPARVHTMYIPIKKRFRIQPNGTLVNFPVYNYCVMGTWLSTTECADFSYRADLFYTNA